MDSQIDNEYFERYKRHILIKNIGGQGQKKLGQAKVLLIGLGGIGSTVLQHLAAAGIGKIGLVDQDTVALSNLQRQTIYKYEDIGRKKVSVASNFVKKLNKNVEITEYNFFLSGDGTTKIIGEYDVVLDGTDNFDTRLLINDYCKKNKKILISAAISKFDGHLFKFNFKKKIPCFRCFMPQQPIQEMNCDVEGIFPPVAGILGSLQANEVLKTILDLKDDLNGNMLIFDSLKMNIRKSKIQINPNCKNICRN